MGRKRSFPNRSGRPVGFPSEQPPATRIYPRSSFRPVYPPRPADWLCSGLVRPVGWGHRVQTRASLQRGHSSVRPSGMPAEGRTSLPNKSWSRLLRRQGFHTRHPDACAVGIGILTCSLRKCGRTWELCDASRKIALVPSERIRSPLKICGLRCIIGNSNTNRKRETLVA